MLWCDPRACWMLGTRSTTALHGLTHAFSACAARAEGMRLPLRECDQPFLPHCLLPCVGYPSRHNAQLIGRLGLEKGWLQHFGRGRTARAALSA
eukprot:6182908-Pleurochrysis_carterae.AAC.2